MTSEIKMFLILAFVVFAAVGLPTESFECLEEGRFPDPQDCGSFVDCVPELSEGFKTTVGSCMGGAFSPELKKCLSAKEVDGCSPRTPRKLKSEIRMDKLCAGKPYSFICGDCKTQVTCTNGTAFPVTCDAGYSCSDKDSFGGGVCYPNEPEDCQCDKSNDFKNDVYDESKFLFCETSESNPVVYSCPEEMKYNATARQCSNTNGLPACSSIGVFADLEDDCHDYYTCIFTTEGWVQKEFSCRNGTNTDLSFNEANGQCEDPCSWDDDQFKCTEEGRFSDPTSCNSYFECIANVDGSFKTYQKECPLNYEWDSPKSLCVLPNSVNHECAPIIVPNKCPIPVNCVNRLRTPL